MHSTQAELSHLYQILELWWIRASQKRQARKQLRAEEKARKAAIQAAKGNLLGNMVPSGTMPASSAEHNARHRLEEAAERMAEKSPYGLTVNRNEPLNPSEHTPRTPQTTGSGVREIDVKPEEILTALAADDLIEQHFGAANKIKLSHQSLTKKVILPKIKPPNNGSYSKISVTREEAILADNLETADAFLPRPRKAEIKKIDTSVTGFWESNPNTDEIIQQASRLPIVHNQIREIIQHLLTSRPNIQGPKELVDPIRKWFEIEMEVTTGHERGIDRFVAEITKQMLYYGSAVLIKQRAASGTKLIKDQLADTMRSPVWNYAIPDMSTMEVFIDKKGRPRKWRQSPNIFPDLNLKNYAARDVFVARLPVQNSSLYFWTPAYVMPVIYAVSVLQDLQANIDAHSRSIIDILYYAQVGGKDYNNGTVTKKMITETITTINQTSRRSTPVFPHYVKLNKLDLDDYTSELVDTAKFWEQEIRRGIGGSSLQDGVGDSSTRNTSDALTEREMRAAQALVPEIQRAFRWLVLDKLYEDPKFDISTINGWDELPSLVFEEIDLAQQLRRGTQATLIWNADGYKHGEFRTELGLEVDPTRADKYFSDIAQENDEKLAAQAAAVKSQAAPGGVPAPKRAKK